MNKLRKILLISTIIITVISCNSKLFAIQFLDNNGEEESGFSKEFLDYSKLPDDEKEKLLPPSPAALRSSQAVKNNLFTNINSVGASASTSYNLRDYIPENMVAKDQGESYLCWDFAALGALESTLALYNYKNNIEAITYDFSEQHMDYASTYQFKDGTNPKGAKRTLGSSATILLSIAYLTNGIGAVNETEMPYTGSTELINLSDLSTNVTTEVTDIARFNETYIPDKTELMNKMKTFIKQNGGLIAGINGASLISDYYNYKTGAIYCDNKENCPVNHAAVIVGWDDKYPASNFASDHQPSKDGAWILKNSWGTVYEISFDTLREAVYEQVKQNYPNVELSDVTDEYLMSALDRMGYPYENNKVVFPVGDNGFVYISYEDVNVYSELYGIEKAYDNVSYDNIYQYNEFGWNITKTFPTNKIYMGNIFTKNTSGTEYLNKISICNPEYYTCKVYVNPNGSSMNKADLQQVQLKTGSTESFDAGYHTIEFESPIPINSAEFAVVVEAQGTNAEYLSIAGEAKLSNTVYESVTIAQDKCFIGNEYDFVNNQMSNLSRLTDAGLSEANWDNPIKAFTTNSNSGSEGGSTSGGNSSGGNGSSNEGGNSSSGSGGNSSEGGSSSSGEQGGSSSTSTQSVNTNLTNAQLNINGLKAYYFTDNTKDYYATIDLEISNINIPTTNDSLEYYFYFSNNPNETNITNYTKINNYTVKDNKISLTINTNDIPNYKELTSSDNDVYIYIQEIAKKGNSQSSSSTNALKLDVNNDIELDNISFYLDGTKIDISEFVNDGNNIFDSAAKAIQKYTETNIQKVNYQSADETVAKGSIPQTGTTPILITILFIIGISGIILFVRYKKINQDIK